MKNFETRIVKQFGILTIANFITLFLAFFLNILITIVVSEEAYGAYKYIISAVAMFASLLNFGIYHSTSRLLANANTIEKERKLYSASFRLLFLIVIVCLGVFISGYLISTYAESTLPVFLYALPLVCTILFQRAFMLMLRGSNRVVDIAIQSLTPQILLFAIYFTIYISGSDNLNVECVLFIYATSYILTHLITFKRLRINVLSRSKIEVNEILLEQKNNGIEIYKGSLAAVFSADLLNVIVGSCVAAPEYASYALAMSFAAPLAQVPATMGTVQFRHNAHRNRIAKKEFIVTIFIGILGLIALNLLVNLLFNTIYEGRYEGTQAYVLILSLTFVIHGLGDYINQFLGSKGKGNYLKKTAYLVGITQVTFAVLLVPFFELWGLVIAKFLSSSIYLIVIYSFYRKESM